jgi:oligogalacturonide transport system permease protein
MNLEQIIKKIESNKEVLSSMPQNNSKNIEKYNLYVNDLYEEARLSGAGYFKQLFKITIPLSTAMIFYNLIMSIISNLQSFSSYATYLQFGRPRDLQFVGLLIYETAYTGEYDISLACAYSWILFLVVGVLTFIVLKTSKQWVYYAEDN